MRSVSKGVAFPSERLITGTVNVGSATTCTLCRRACRNWLFSNEQGVEGIYIYISEALIYFYWHMSLSFYIFIDKVLYACTLLRTNLKMTEADWEKTLLHLGHSHPLVASVLGLRCWYQGECSVDNVLSSCGPSPFHPCLHPSNAIDCASEGLTLKRNGALLTLKSPIKYCFSWCDGSTAIQDWELFLSLFGPQLLHAQTEGNNSTHLKGVGEG